MSTFAVDASINQWGNGLAVRINRTVAKTAGVGDGTPVRIVAEPGRIVIETVEKKPSLDDMLMAYDHGRHGGEAMMTQGPVGAEII